MEHGYKNDMDISARSYYYNLRHVLPAKDVAQTIITDFNAKEITDGDLWETLTDDGILPISESNRVYTELGFKPNAGFPLKKLENGGPISGSFKSTLSPHTYNAPDYNPFNIPIYEDGKGYIYVFKSDIEPIWIQQNELRHQRNAAVEEKRSELKKIENRKTPKSTSARIELSNKKYQTERELENLIEQAEKTRITVGAIAPRALNLVYNEDGTSQPVSEYQSELLSKHGDEIYGWKYAKGGPLPTEQVLWGTKIGAADWEEQIITTDPDKFEMAKAWAKDNGFDRLRISTINMNEKPNFTKSVKKLSSGGVLYSSDRNEYIETNDSGPQILTIKSGMYKGSYVIKADGSVLTEETDAPSDTIKKYILNKVTEIENKTNTNMENTGKSAAELKEEYQAILEKRKELSTQITDTNKDQIEAEREKLWNEAEEINKLYKEARSIEIEAEAVARRSIIESWESLPDSLKIVKNTPKVPYTNSPFDKGLQKIMASFTGDDSLRPVMAGVNFDKLGITATDAHRLLHLPYPNKKYNGIYCVSTDCRKLTGEEADKIKGNYPAYEKVFVHTNPYISKISVLKLKTFVRAILLGDFANKITHQVRIGINKDEGEIIAHGFNAKFLEETLDTFLKLGFEYVYIGSSAPNRASVLSPSKAAAKHPAKYVGKEILALVMPVLVEQGDNTKAGYPIAAQDLDFARGLHVSYCAFDDQIYNNDGSIAVFDFNLTKPVNRQITDLQESILKAYFQKNNTIPIIDFAYAENDTLTATNLSAWVTLKNVNLSSGLYRFAAGALINDKSANPQDFPNSPFTTETGKAEFKPLGTINRNELLFHFEKAILCVGNDNLRPHFNGVHLVKNESTGNKLFIEATNAHILYRNEIKNQTISGDINVIIQDSKQALVFLKNITDTHVSVSVSGTNIAMDSESASIVHRLIDGKFPNVSQAIPKHTKQVVFLNIKNLKDCIKSIKKEEKKSRMYFNKPVAGKCKVDLYKWENSGSRDAHKSIFVRHLCDVQATLEQNETTTNGNVFLGMPVQQIQDMIFGLDPDILQTFIKITESEDLNIHFNQPNQALVLTDQDIDADIEIINAPAPAEKSKSPAQSTQATNKDEIESEISALYFLASISNDQHSKQLIEKQISKLKTA